MRNPFPYTHVIETFEGVFGRFDAGLDDLSTILPILKGGGLVVSTANPIVKVIRTPNTERNCLNLFIVVIC